jgi:hypothetical protein
MAITYEPIATYTADGTTNPITFSSIPSTYTDLRFVLSVNANQGTTGGYSNFSYRLNSNAANNYGSTVVVGDGTSAGSFRIDSTSGYTYGSVTGVNIPATNEVPTFITMDIFSYTNATWKTSLLTFSFNRNSTGGVQRAVSVWRQTSAITSVSFDVDGFGGVSGRAFKAGSTFTLYGIKNA